MGKKLVQINTVCNGSTGKIMVGIQQQAEKDGYEVYNFFGRGKPANDRCFKICNKLDIYWHLFISRLFDMQGHGCKHATKKLVKQLRQINPDVIQLHNLHGYYINIKILFDYLENCNAKIVWTLHDCWTFTGHCTHFTFVNCDKWKKQCINCPQKNEYPKSIFIDRSYKNYIEKKNLFTKCNNITLVTPSKWLANIVNQSFLKKYEIKVINNGIDLNIFKPTESNFREKYNLQDKKIILGVASVWTERKGLNDFIKLSQILNDNYRIVLVGLNKNQIKKLPENIIGITRTENQKELAGLYSTADVFLNLSVEETMGLTTVESMACGTPVIVNNSTAIPEVVNAKVGNIIENNDLQKCISIIENEIKKSNIEKFIIQAKEYNENKKYKEYISLFME